ncbi:MAG: phosphoribosylformylglycinamidine synthase I [Lysobacterales bacterium]|jgi:phosphoribosylformylglycinamidine synthase I
MTKQVKVLVLRTAGTNCDVETVFAFEQCGASVDAVHIKKLREKSVMLDDYHILAIPGGFTYGDDIESGRILANELRVHLGGEMTKFIEDGKLIIGICNGFQVLVKAGILPGSLPKKEVKSGIKQQVSLSVNDSNKFESRWTHLRSSGKCVWTEGVEDVVYYPVAHAEGKFITPNKDLLNQLKDNGRVVFRYCDEDGLEPKYPNNPNGSDDHIAGITDETGRILGLMPHPERHFLFTQHPFWTRLGKKQKLGEGSKIFKNGVDYVKNNLL